MSEAANTYRIVTLPKPQDGSKFIRLAEKFTALRLHALQTSPDAFGSTYDVEIQRSLDQTMERMKNPKATQFIAVRTRASDSPYLAGDDDVDRIVKQDWVGMIVLLGPQDGSDTVRPRGGDPFNRMTAAAGADQNTSNQGLREPSAELHYHLNGMFVDPTARNGGLGKALIDAAMRKAEHEAAKMNSALRVSIAVYAHNVSASKLYQRAGFKVIEQRPSATYSDRAAVDLELVLAAEP